MKTHVLLLNVGVILCCKQNAQKELAGYIGVSPSRINDYIAGRSEPTLKVARLLCMELNIAPAAMLRV
jgi:HTH-type transcriptional regulator/antitoxin HigA